MHMAPTDTIYMAYVTDKISNNINKHELLNVHFHFIAYRSFSLTWSVAPVGWWNNTKYLNKKELIPVPYTNMAAISLFWYTNMAAVTSDENDLYCWATIQVPGLDHACKRWSNHFSPKISVKCSSKFNTQPGSQSYKNPVKRIVRFVMH
jgi:hypothetical protein